ncbi:MAG TPA: hypothetical protein VFM60_01830 [Salinimicrobium sp.]|nr:hypothetical protein [Salinimicrobium sp.]
MKLKPVLFIILGVVLLYPVISLIFLAGNLSPEGISAGFESSLGNYQASIWVSWIVFVTVSVYYKWTEKKDLFFWLTYGFIIISGIILGYFIGLITEGTAISGPGEFGNQGFWAGLQQIITAVMLTGILQACVWWFTRNPHRRMR